MILIESEATALDGRRKPHVRSSSHTETLSWRTPWPSCRELRNLSSNALFQSRDGVCLDNCRCFASLDFDLLPESHGSASRPCRPDPRLQHAQPWDGELPCFLHLGCSNFHKFIDGFCNLTFRHCLHCFGLHDLHCCDHGDGTRSKELE